MILLNKFIGIRLDISDKLFCGKEWGCMNYVINGKKLFCHGPNELSFKIKTCSLLSTHICNGRISVEINHRELDLYIDTWRACPRASCYLRDDMRHIYLDDEYYLRGIPDSGPEYVGVREFIEFYRLALNEAA